jgi:hypothetical protein
MTVKLRLLLACVLGASALGACTPVVDRRGFLADESQKLTLQQVSTQKKLS